MKKYLFLIAICFMIFGCKTSNGEIQGEIKDTMVRVILNTNNNSAERTIEENTTITYILSTYIDHLNDTSSGLSPVFENGENLELRWENPKPGKHSFLIKLIAIINKHDGENPDRKIIYNELKKGEEFEKTRTFEIIENEENSIVMNLEINELELIKYEIYKEE